MFFMVVGIFAEHVTKLKVGAIELEKIKVDQIDASSSILKGIPKAPIRANA